MFRFVELLKDRLLLMLLLPFLPKLASFSLFKTVREPKFRMLFEKSFIFGIARTSFWIYNVKNYSIWNDQFSSNKMHTLLISLDCSVKLLVCDRKFRHCFFKIAMLLSFSASSLLKDSAIGKYSLKRLYKIWKEPIQSSFGRIAKTRHRS